MTLANALTILAMLLAPLVALRVSRALDRRRERRERQMAIFRTLMATRARKLGQDHVEALNLIDVEFAERTSSERRVADAWKLYLDHLNRPPTTGETWGARADELFVDLVHSMATCLGYDFDKVHIKNQSYSPRAHGDLENDQQALRKGLIALLQGRGALPIHQVAEPIAPSLQLPDARTGTPQGPDGEPR